VTKARKNTNISAMISPTKRKQLDELVEDEIHYDVRYNNAEDGSKEGSDRNAKRRHVVNEASRTNEKDIVPRIVVVNGDGDRTRTFVISDVQPLMEHTHVGFFAIVKYVGEITHTKQDKSLRRVTVCDDSGVLITMTLWDKAADEFSYDVGSVIRIQNALVKTYNNVRQLNAVKETVITPGAESERAKDLLGWWKTNQHEQFSLVYDSIVKTTSIEDVCKRANARHDRTIYACVRGSIQISREDISYHPCTVGSCKKKLTLNEAEGVWKCEREHVVRKALLRKYRLNLTFEDESESAYITAFDEVAEELLGISAADLSILEVRRSRFIVVLYIYVCACVCV
jgi:replication factor A1